MSLNKVMLIGNVGRDPEVRYLEGNAPANGGNTKVATFTLATTERYKDRSGEVRENTEWHNIVAWRNSADIAEKYIRKGTQLYIEGRLRTRSWTDQAGVKKYTTGIMVDSLQLLGRRPEGNAPAQGAYQNAAQPAYQPQQPVYQAPQPAYQAPQPQPAQQQAAINISLDENPADDLPF